MHAAHAPRYACTGYHVTMGGEGGMEYWGRLGAGGGKQILLEWESAGRVCVWGGGSCDSLGHGIRKPGVATPGWRGCRRQDASSISSRSALMISLSRESTWLHASACISISTSQPQAWEVVRTLAVRVVLLDCLKRSASHKAFAFNTDLSRGKKKKGGGHAAGRLCAERISAGGRRPEMQQAAVCYL